MYTHYNGTHNNVSMPQPVDIIRTTVNSFVCRVYNQNTYETVVGS